MLAAVIILSAAVGFMVASSTPYGYSAYADNSKDIIKQKILCDNYNHGGTGGGGAPGAAAAAGDGNTPPAADAGVAGGGGDIDISNICGIYVK